jgi:hypothetical protein
MYRPTLSYIILTAQERTVAASLMWKDKNEKNSNKFRQEVINVKFKYIKRLPLARLYTELKGRMANLLQMI